MLYPIELWVRKCRILAERARGVNRFWEHLELNFWEDARLKERRRGAVHSKKAREAEKVRQRSVGAQFLAVGNGVSLNNQEEEIRKKATLVRKLARRVAQCAQQ